VDGRFGSGFWTAQQELTEADRAPAFLDVEAARTEPERFGAWFEAARPDVILTLHTVVREWIEALGLRVPRDLGLIQLERRRGCENWAGMDQHNDLVGEAAVDMLLTALHNEEPGLPAAPRATLIGASWAEGVTVRRAAALT
jgi:LacI family transcriptional regulator